jgi:hypothetical protein
MAQDKTRRMTASDFFEPVTSAIDEYGLTKGARERRATRDERFRKVRMARETARVRPKIEAHRAQRRKIIRSRKAY